MDKLDLAKELFEFIDAKGDLNKTMLEVLHTKDRQKALEMLVENTVNDIYMYGKIRYKTGADPSESLDDKTIERMKKMLFDILQT